MKTWLTLRFFIIIVFASALICYDEPRIIGHSAQTNVAYLDDSVVLSYDKLFSPSAVKQFYDGRASTPAWIADSMAKDRDSLVQFIRQIGKHGLFPSEYHLHEIDSLSDKTSFSPALQLDILLTDAFLKAASHLHLGRLNSRTLTPIASFSGPDSSLTSLLEKCIRRHDVVYTLKRSQPSQVQYAQLQHMLNNKLLEYDKRLISNESKDSLSKEIVKLAVNMERWRWERDFPENYLLVNIPSYQLSVMQKDDRVLSSRIIVGLPEKATPTLTSRIDCIVIYPYWNVPRSIATKELLPVIQGRPTYMSENNFDVVNSAGEIVEVDEIDWTKYSPNYFPYRLRQREGPENALGIIKFHFDNPYGVYLHDTNSPGLFIKKVRALSHGCIRVEKARELARLLVARDSGKTDAKLLAKFISERRRRDIELTKPLAIMVRYFTADADGVYEDIYSMDAELVRAFDGFLQDQQDVHSRSVLLGYGKWSFDKETDGSANFENGRDNVN
jgi:L,D-transpeptidase YcbB